jgi:endonuclease YncB( thermonuclease family)
VDFQTQPSRNDQETSRFLYIPVPSSRHTTKGVRPQALEQLVKGQDVTCKGDTRDRYKRLLAIFYVGPFNINEQMVTDGRAVAYRKYSKDYVRAETFAKSRREGLWRGEFEPSWEGRRR